MSEGPFFTVRFLASAEQDLRSLGTYVAQDSKAKASKLISQLVDACQSLAQFPHRGHIPLELSGLSDHYLQIYQGPYRLIYQIKPPQVVIFAILDGRRDLTELLPTRFGEDAP
ncbi:MAG: type II toxin-antitoxin system RelE/ParE family toxin [bacterium]|nr:type II toxin-antitoxin system RelE/ParE family toxin [bacterium]